MTSLLRDILAATRNRVAGLAAERAALERAAARTEPGPAWVPAFAGDRVGVIAEVKRRSPSAGAIAPDLDPGALARRYEQGGAAAISVLTEGPHFGGSLDDLTAVRRAVVRPVLRKDFILDPLQLLEARAAGASAVLLIVRALEPAALRALSETARELGLARLVEVHDRGELDAAVALGPEAIGVNSRDLETFAVDLPGAAALLDAVPGGILAVAESGVSTREQVELVAAHGADAVLVGTAVARHPDPAAAVAALTGVARRGRGAARTLTA